MNMQTFKSTYLRFFLLFGLGLSVECLLISCKKEKNIHYEYGVNNEYVLPSNVGKTRLKTTEQYVNILYVNLFQKSLSSNQISRITQAFESLGDQNLAKQIFISKLLNSPNVLIPTQQEMLADIDKFVTDTYLRFYLRKPTQSEKEYLKQAILADPNITPQLVFMAFALSNEYMYY